MLGIKILYRLFSGVFQADQKPNQSSAATEVIKDAGLFSARHNRSFERESIRPWRNHSELKDFRGCFEMGHGGRFSDALRAIAQPLPRPQLLAACAEGLPFLRAPLPASGFQASLHTSRQFGANAVDQTLKPKIKK